MRARLSLPTWTRKNRKTLNIWLSGFVAVELMVILALNVFTPTIQASNAKALAKTQTSAQVQKLGTDKGHQKKHMVATKD